MHSGLEALTTYAVLRSSLERPEWLGDKQSYYWALIDPSTGRPANSKDSRSYFIALLISPNSLYFISSSAFSLSSFALSLSLAFISFCAVLKVNRFFFFFSPVWQLWTFSPENFLMLFHKSLKMAWRKSLSRGLRQSNSPHVASDRIYRQAECVPSVCFASFW